MKESVERFFKGIGVDADTINAFKADKLPDDFDMESAQKTFLQKRRELTLNDGDLLKELKQKHNSESYPAIIKPLIKDFKRQTGLDDEQIKSITDDGKSLPDMKKLFALGVGNLKKTTSSTVDEVRQEVFEWKNKFETAKANHEQAISEIKNGFESKIKQSKISRGFSDKLQSRQFTFPLKTVNELLFNNISTHFDFTLNEDGEPGILNKDGTRPTDGKNFLTLDDIIDRTAEEYNIVKKSNGGSGNTPPAGGGKTPKFIPNTKVSPSVQRMIDAANRKR